MTEEIDRTERAKRGGVLLEHIYVCSSSANFGKWGERSPFVCD